MKRLFMSLAAVGAALSISSAMAAGPQQEVVSSASLKTVPVTAKNFTGSATATVLWRGQDPMVSYGGIVTFAPGARTYWHTHPQGQVLYILSGEGYTQQEGGPRIAVRVGDVVICPPGVKHWHGAAPNNAMSHLAVGERVPGQQVQWFSAVTAEQYQGE